MTNIREVPEVRRDPGGVPPRRLRGAPWVIGLAVSLVVSLVVAACSADPEQLRMREEYERELEKVPDLMTEERRLLLDVIMKPRFEEALPPEVPPSTRAKLEAYESRLLEDMRLAMEVRNREEALAEELRTPIYLGGSVKRFEPESNSLTIECLYENASGKDTCRHSSFAIGAITLKHACTD